MPLIIIFPFPHSDEEEEDGNSEELRNIATHDCVFFLSGLEPRWKIPVGYHFTSGTFDRQAMVEFITELIREAKRIANVRVRILANDMGPCNMGVWRIFEIDLARNPLDPLQMKNTFVVDGMTIWVCADFEHVLKNWRCAWYNMFVGTKNRPSFNFQLSEASFSKYKEAYDLVSIEACFGHIVELHKFQKVSVYKYAPRLTDECFALTNNYSKMCVPTAIHVLHQDVAAGLRMLVKHHGYPKAFNTTALFCEFFGKWTKIMLSRSSSTGSLTLENFDEWKSFFEEFMIFVDSLKVHPTQTHRKEFQKGLNTGLQI